MNVEKGGLNLSLVLWSYKDSGKANISSYTIAIDPVPSILEWTLPLELNNS